MDLNELRKIATLYPNDRVVDGKTVLALITRLEQAEAAAARVRALAEDWKSRGEHDMEYSKTIPPDIGEIINEGGAEMVHKANLIYRALDGDTRG